MVSAETNSPEGELAASAGRLAIPIGDAGTHFFIEALPQIGIVAHQTGGKSKGCSIGLGNRGVKIGDANHLE